MHRVHANYLPLYGTGLENVQAGLNGAPNAQRCREWRFLCGMSSSKVLATSIPPAAVALLDRLLFRVKKSLRISEDSHNMDYCVRCTYEVAGKGGGGARCRDKWEKSVTPVVVSAREQTEWQNKAAMLYKQNKAATTTVSSNSSEPAKASRDINGCHRQNVISLDNTCNHTRLVSQRGMFEQQRNESPKHGSQMSSFLLTAVRTTTYTSFFYYILNKLSLKYANFDTKNFFFFAILPGHPSQRPPQTSAGGGQEGSWATLPSWRTHTRPSWKICSQTDHPSKMYR